jgi:AbrB family looped-hinge helix DNA binding protein
MSTAKMTSKGQITIPKGVREKLGIGPGDEIEFVEEGGEFLIRRRLRQSPFDKYLGYLKGKEGQDPDEIVRELRGHQLN